MTNPSDTVGDASLNGTAPTLTPASPPVPLSPVYLDRAGDAIAPPECAQAASDVEWLPLALEPGPLVVRGPVCARAEPFYRGRGRTCHELQSPRVALGALGLSEEGVAWLRQSWGDEFNDRFRRLPQPLRPADVLRAMFPTSPVSWNAAPSPSHAADWLMWLDSARPPLVLEPLLRLHANGWATQAKSEALFYEAADAEAARAYLRLWLGLEARPKMEESRALEAVGLFPREVPVLWLHLARDEWMGQVVDAGVELWEEVLSRAMPSALRGAAASVVAKYLEAHPEQLTPETIVALEEFLNADEAARLRDLIPPVPPSALSPESSGREALEWFEREYWPFRAWQVRHARRSGDALAQAQAREKALAAARAWAEWYLKFYAHALGSGVGAEHLALNRSRSLHSPALPARPFEGVTLWVIADGLSVADARVLARHLTARAPRLVAEGSESLLAVLPTITPIAKPALRWSTRPSAASTSQDSLGAYKSDGTRSFGWPHSSAVGRELKEHGDVSALSQAQTGEVWVWNILEPDHTYHKNYPPETTLADVASRLEHIATRIANASEAIGDHALRVIVTTDHGRLPTSSARHHPVPRGCHSHGRAAVVTNAEQASAIAFAARDFIWERDEHGERAWLNPHRFGLSVPAVLAVDENAFKQNDGSGGEEHFSHGGLFPEETVVPWLSFGRDRALPRIEARIGGSGKAGTLGTLTLKVRNASQVPVVLLKAVLHFGPRDEREVGLSLSLPVLQSIEHEAPLLRWPDSGAAERASATLILARTDGTTFEAEASLDLHSEELYRPASGLEEFDL